MSKQQPTLVEQLEYIAYMQNDANSPTLRMAVIKLDRLESLVATIREAAEACGHEDINFDIRVIQILDEAAGAGKIEVE